MPLATPSSHLAAFRINGASAATSRRVSPLAVTSLRMLLGFAVPSFSITSSDNIVSGPISSAASATAARALQAISKPLPLSPNQCPQPPLVTEFPALSTPIATEPVPTTNATPQPSSVPQTSTGSTSCITPTLDESLRILAQLVTSRRTSGEVLPARARTA